MKRRQMLMGLAATLVPGLAQASPTIAVSGYEGREVVPFDSPEQPGTLLVNTGEKALYRILGEGLAMRYAVAVGKEGHDWAGIAEIGRKVEWPTWTPPSSMIQRSPNWRAGPAACRADLTIRSVHARFIFTRTAEIRCSASMAPMSPSRLERLHRLDASAC